MSDIKKIILIGASAGGFKAIKQLISLLPEQRPVAIFIVLHLSKNSLVDVICKELKKETSYNCHVPRDGDPIATGNIYVAPADLHMLITGDMVRLTKGPHENRWRPSIDVLFRSAAASYDSRTIGIILTGLLDDGTSGMSAIKRSGGLCIVQEPVEAEFPDMPASVINKVDVDHRVPIADMGYIIDDEISKPVVHKPIPDEVKIEAKITERMMSSLEEMQKIGTHSNFTCPDCGGGLWKIKDEKIPRYRCHTGHVYTEKILLEKQTEELEESLWVSIRMLEERRNLLLTMAGRNDVLVPDYVKDEQLKRAESIQVHIERLKALLVSINKNESTDEGYL